MATTMFQYPGGKSHLSGKITDLMPQHSCYVEGFGGSGAVLLNKPKAEVNVYNDLDSDLVHFFTVYRERPQELIEKLEGMCYSYEYYESVAKRFYNDEFNCDTLVGGRELCNEVTEDHVMRAAVFFYLRYTQFGSKYNGKSGFGRSKQLNQAETFTNAKERLNEFIGFWDDVTIDNVSYEKLVESYDMEDTLFYFDPPYIGTEQYYRESDFSHQNFCKVLDRIKGHWIVSYDEVPDGLDGYYLIQEESTNYIDSGVKGEGKDTTESLILNFDPDSVRKFNDAQQTGLFDDRGDENGSFEYEVSEAEATVEFEEEDTEEEDDGWLENAI